VQAQEGAQIAHVFAHMPTFLPTQICKFLLPHAESCKRKVTISAREMVTNRLFEEESPYKPEEFTSGPILRFPHTFSRKNL